MKLAPWAGNSRRFSCLILLYLAAAPGIYATSLYTGTFPADNQVALFAITADISETITIQTYSYAGGTVNSTIIPSGGFAPVAFLFDGLGGVLTLTAGDSSQVAQDPTTSNYDDLYFQDALGPGTYTLALAVDDNAPVDTFASDGFVQDVNPGFTCQEAGGSGNFCDLTAAFPLDNARTGDYAISIAGADAVSPVIDLPEPGSMLLLLTGCALTALLRRRSISR